MVATRTLSRSPSVCSALPCAANGENEEARQWFEESLEICRVHGFSRGAVVLSVSPSLCGRRVCEGPRVLPGEHRARLGDGIPGAGQPILRGIAAIALAGGDTREAATLLGVFAAFVERIGALPSIRGRELDAAIAQAREALGNDAFDAAWAEGGGLSLDQAVELSLSVTAIEPLEAH